MGGKKYFVGVVGFGDIESGITVIANTDHNVNHTVTRYFNRGKVGIIYTTHDTRRKRTITSNVYTGNNSTVFLRASYDGTSTVGRLISGAITRCNGLSNIIDGTNVNVNNAPLRRCRMRSCRGVFSLGDRNIFTKVGCNTRTVLGDRDRNNFLVGITSITNLMPRHKRTLCDTAGFNIINVAHTTTLSCTRCNVAIGTVYPNCAGADVFNSTPTTTVSFFTSSYPTGQVNSPRRYTTLTLFLTDNVTQCVANTTVPISNTLSTKRRDIDD